MIQLLAELPVLDLEPFEYFTPQWGEQTKAWQMDGRNWQSAELAREDG